MHPTPMNNDPAVKTFEADFKTFEADFTSTRNGLTGLSAEIDALRAEIDNCGASLDTCEAKLDALEKLVLDYGKPRAQTPLPWWARLLGVYPRYFRGGHIG